MAPTTTKRRHNETQKKGNNTNTILKYFNPALCTPSPSCKKTIKRKADESDDTLSSSVESARVASPQQVACDILSLSSDCVSNDDSKSSTLPSLNPYSSRKSKTMVTEVRLSQKNIGTSDRSQLLLSPVKEYTDISSHSSSLSLSPLLKKRRSNTKNFSSIATTTATPPKKSQTQLYLDFGQADFARRTICQTCGMLYVHGLDDDRQNHEKICSDFRHGVPHVAPWKNERVARFVRKGIELDNDVWEEEDDEAKRIIEIRPGDPISHRRKVYQVKKIVDDEMGFVGNYTSVTEEEREYEASLYGRTVYLYISNQRIVGFLAAEIIKEGYRLNPDGARSKRPQRAILGVHQIWCHRDHRGCGVGAEMMSAARERMVFGYRVPLEKVAFSSPTADGIRFAKKILKTESPLIYVIS